MNDSILWGTVVNCIKLNVRSAPDMTESVLTIIPVSSKIQVDMAVYLDDWYKVYTETGVEGFCMKQYIEVEIPTEEPKPEPEPVWEPQTDTDVTESILNSVKKLLGIEENYVHFDADLMLHINSVLAVLTQLGIGSPKGFSIKGKRERWRDFLGSSSQNVSYVKSYVYLKVKLLFDPPINASVIESMNRQISEFEWRLSTAAESGKGEDTNG